MITARRVALILIAVLATLALPASALAASIGPNYGTGTSIDSPATADISWANPGNIGAADTTYATAPALPAAGGTSFYLYAKDFKFTVPEGATINGITVEINRLAQGGGVRDTLVQLTKDGSALLGSNLALTGTNWPTGAPAVQVYGSASSLWGVTWSVAEINSQDFGVALQVSNGHRNKAWTASVDYIRVAVTYTPPPRRLR